MTIVRLSTTLGSTLQEGALALRYKGRPIKPHTVGRRNRESIKPVISSEISLVEPTATTVISLTDKVPLLPAFTRIVVVLLDPLVAFAGAVTRTRNTIRPPGGNTTVVSAVNVT